MWSRREEEEEEEMGRRKCPSVTYVVVEGLGLTGVLACLPPVWSRAIQVPEYTEKRRDGGGRAEVRGYLTQQYKQMYNSNS